MNAAPDASRVAGALATLAPATRRAYTASLRRLGVLDGETALDDLALASALWSMSDAGYSASTVRQASYAVRWLARVLDKHAALGAAFAGAAAAVASNQAEPTPLLGWDQADRIISDLLDSDDLRDIRAAALTAVICDGLLRAGEAAPIAAEDLRVLNDGTARLTLDHRIVVITARTMAAVDWWRSVARIRAGRLWRSLRELDNPVAGISASTIRIELRRVLGVRALSVRLGSASSLASAGASAAEIKDAGGWHSETSAAALVAANGPARVRSSAVARYRS